MAALYNMETHRWHTDFYGKEKMWGSAWPEEILSINQRLLSVL